MHILRGAVRFILVILVLAGGTVLILAVAWLPLRVRGTKPGGWLASGIARYLVRLFDIAVEPVEDHKILGHTGLIFPNHLSFMDILLLMRLRPVRFVSMAELRRWPFVGWIAMAVDTVFVNRGDMESRQETRQQLAGQDSFNPPIVLFPEGKISMSGELLPFRYGAFEVAVEGKVPFLPCVIVYEPLPIVGWTDETLLQALWRVACYRGQVRARLIPLHVIHPQADDDPKQLASQTHGAMTAVLQYSDREDDVLNPDL